MWKIVLLLGFASLAAATIDTIGPCTKNVKAIKIDFNEYAESNHGVWYFRQVVDTPKNSQFKSLTSVIKFTKTPGLYEDNIYYVDKDGKNGTFAREYTRWSPKHAVVISKGINNNYTLKIFYIKYVPGEWAYYYICSDDGGDTANDYRYVVSTGKLSEKDKKEIAKLDKENEFKGRMVDI